MAVNVNDLNRKVLQHLRTSSKDAQAIGPHGALNSVLSGVAAVGEIVIQLGDSGATASGTSLWVLGANDEAIRFVNQAYVDEKAGGEASQVKAIVDRMEEAIGLEPTGNTEGSLPSTWGTGTTYFNDGDTIIDAIN